LPAPLLRFERTRIEAPRWENQDLNEVAGVLIIGTGEAEVEAGMEAAEASRKP